MKILPLEVDIAIKELSAKGLSSRAIGNELKSRKIFISKSSVNNVLKNHGLERATRLKSEPKPEQKRLKKVRTPANILKVKNAMKENPVSQRVLANRLNMAQTTVRKIIHKDLDLVTRKKTALHMLTPNDKLNRKTNFRKLYKNHLAGDRSEFVVTVDEAWVYLNDCNQKSPICYVKRGEKTPGDWILNCKECFPKGFMVIGALSGRGPLPLIKVPGKVKVNSKYYVDYVLRPLFEEHVLKIYTGELNKVYFHHDKASSHTAKFTTDYLSALR